MRILEKTETILPIGDGPRWDVCIFSIIGSIFGICLMVSYFVAGTQTEVLSSGMFLLIMALTLFMSVSKTDELTFDKNENEFSIKHIRWCGQDVCQNRLNLITDIRAHGRLNEYGEDSFRCMLYIVTSQQTYEFGHAGLGYPRRHYLDAQHVIREFLNLRETHDSLIASKTRLREVLHRVSP